MNTDSKDERRRSAERFVATTARREPEWTLLIRESDSALIGFFVVMNLR